MPPWGSGGALIPPDTTQTGSTHIVTAPTILTQMLQNIKSNQFKSIANTLQK